MKSILKTKFLAAALLGALAFTSARAADVAPSEARAIAKEAYIYGYPMVDGYRIQHAYCVNRENPEFKAPWNQLRNIPRVFTPEDKAVQTPNSDTPYSMVGLDLRAEPMVLTVPAIEKERYFSIQLIDEYTHNFAYIGTLNPLIPFSLNDDWSLIVRTAVPMTYAESPASGVRTKTGLGDISQTFYVSPKKSVGHWIWGAGPTFLFPSASEHGLGAEKWAAGPAMGILQQHNGWTYGVLISQLWSVAGESSRSSVNGTTIAPFVSYITKRLTSVGLNVGSIYDWRLGRETLPVELSTTQVLKIGGQYVSFSLGGRYYAQRPVGGPDWGMDFTISLLFPRQTGRTAIANPSQ